MLLWIFRGSFEDVYPTKRFDPRWLQVIKLGLIVSGEYEYKSIYENFRL